MGRGKLNESEISWNDVFEELPSCWAAMELEAVGALLKTFLLFLGRGILAGLGLRGRKDHYFIFLFFLLFLILQS